MRYHHKVAWSGHHAQELHAPIWAHNLDLCNSIINAHRLATLNVRETADIVVLYNNAWDSAKSAGVEKKFRKLEALPVQELNQIK